MEIMENMHTKMSTNDKNLAFANYDELALKATKMKFRNNDFNTSIYDKNNFYNLAREYFGMELLGKSLVIEKLLYSLTESDFQDYSPQNILSHVNCILDMMTKSQRRGYVTLSDISDVDLYKIFQEVVFSRQLQKLDSFNEVRGYNLFELEHLNNLIYLYLLKDLTLTIRFFQFCGGDLTIELEKDGLLFEIETVRKRILTYLTPGIRNSLAMNRVYQERTFYTGFDTEYQTIELGVNELLCVTTALFARAVVKIKNLHFDFTVTNVISKAGDRQLLPSTNKFIELLTRVIRHLNSKEDFALDSLQVGLDNSKPSTLDVRKEKDGLLIYLNDSS